MYIPQVDTTGLFTLKSPFDKLITPNVVYTCRAVRSINDYLALGESVFEKFYEPLKIELEIYQEDLENNTKIVSLQAGTGEWIYVPASFIEEPPNSNGVKYVPIVMGVSLGAIPDHFNLEPLINQFKELVLNTTGIDSEIKAVIVSQPGYITHEEHERLEIARKTKINNYVNTQLVNNQLRSENDKLREKITILETYIKSKL